MPGVLRRLLYNAPTMDANLKPSLQDTVFTIQLNNKRPIELVDLTNSFLTLVRAVVNPITAQHFALSDNREGQTT